MMMMITMIMITVMIMTMIMIKTTGIVSLAKFCPGQVGFFWEFGTTVVAPLLFIIFFISTAQAVL